MMNKVCAQRTCPPAKSDLQEHIPSSYMPPTGHANFTSTDMLQFRRHIGGILCCFVPTALAHSQLLHLWLVAALVGGTKKSAFFLVFRRIDRPLHQQEALQEAG
jgi:hypothetical protein